MANPIISIIIATYNSGKTLRRCLESILPQLMDVAEVVIVDGNSHDDTLEIVHSYGNKISVCISEPDKGVYDAWNKGIKACHGKWVAFIGSDDEMLPNTIQKYMNFLSTHGDNYDLVCGKLYFVNQQGKILRKVGEPWDWKKHCERKLNFAHPGMLHSVKLLTRLNGFDLQYRICADSDFLQRVGPDINAGFIDDYLVKMSEGGMSDGMKAMKEGFLSRKNNKCIPLWYNYYQHGVMLTRYYGGKLLRKLKLK